ncbi:signal peptidase II [Enterococcus saigonensis]|uniref:Signal peptidase II n=1 Tax=Enterococcus saigonensis TaxID=1805431 RepID=A0A679IQ77_9ENTE|nr:stage 0 sporulation family protein [Enterococcus saigonensis]BCA85247.1 signal peptidase II [Enterococcus saigonensis]
MEVVGVRYKEAGHIYYYRPAKNQTYRYEEKVIVESQQVKLMAEVVIPKVEIDSTDLPDQVLPILHSATSAELQRAAQNEEDAKAAFVIGKKKIRHHELAMKLVSVEYTFDRSKMIFYFTADGRIDFRELVKDLASEFRTRIELRQIGVRDEAKLLGGIGPCGRALCCTTFLGDFIPVSIKMAKDQGLSLNPTKISGLCGRLMCCLKYENDEYEAAKRELPDYGKEIDTPDGRGKVIGLNLLNRVVKIRLFQRETPVEYHYDELKEFEAEQLDKVKTSADEAKKAGDASEHGQT